MPPKTQLIDMIRTVPEVAVRLWAGGQSIPSEDGVRISFEHREITVAKEIFDEARKVAKTLAIRWGARMLRGIQDVLELRHAAEDVFLENLFHKEDVPSVLFVPSGQTAAAYYRAMIPADLMNEGGRVISNWTSKVDLAKVLRYDVLWVQLITSSVLAEIVRQAKAEGIKIVYDIDDRLDAIPDENQAKSVYDIPEKQAEIAEMIALADLVTVTTNPLAEHIAKRHGRPVRVLPNMLTANVAPRRHPPNPDFVRILWAGSATHKRDLAIMGPAMRELLQERQGKVRFTLFGERLPEILADCYKWIDLKKPVDFEDYADDLAEISADFGIVPLERNEFNTGKSGLKGLEYAAAGYPVLCSPAAEYPEMVEAGFPAEVVQDDGWLSALRRMVDKTRVERDAMGKACLDWVMRNRCMGKTKADQWADVVVDLLKDRPKREKPEPKLRLVNE
jgi:glycosyltransferase involved in cell wall biosynthesis